MTVSNKQLSRQGKNSWRLTCAVSPAGSMLYYWRDGRLAKQTVATSFDFYVADGERTDVDVFDDPDAVQADSFLSRPTLQWESTGADSYRIYQRVDGVDTQIGEVRDVGQWMCRFDCPWLDDCTEYQFVVTAVVGGIESEPQVIEDLFYVREPDRPEVKYSVSGGTLTVDEV